MVSNSWPAVPPPRTGSVRPAFSLTRSVLIFITPRAVFGHQDEVLAVLFVDDHVQRLIAVAQLGDRRAADFLAGIEVSERNPDQRRAGETGE